MAFRLAIVTFSVAGLAYITTPFRTLVAFLIFGALPICYSTYVSLQASQTSDSCSGLGGRPERASKFPE